jgi:hypothetical protein
MGPTYSADEIYKKYSHKVVEEPEGREPFWRARLQWWNYIKIYSKEIRRECADKIQLA